MNEKSKTHWGLWIAAVVMLAFAVYPLSIGPASVIYSRSVGTNSQRIFETFYAPIIFAMQRDPVWTGSVFTSYLRWWHDLVKS